MVVCWLRTRTSVVEGRRVTFRSHGDGLQEFRRTRRLRRGAPHVLRPGTLRTLADVELDAVSLAQIVEALALDCTLVEETLLAGRVLDEPEPLVYPQCSNLARHQRLQFARKLSASPAHVRKRRSDRAYPRFGGSGSIRGQAPSTEFP